MLKVVREASKSKAVLILGVLALCFLFCNNTLAEETSSSRKSRLRVNVDTVLTVNAPELFEMQMKANDTPDNRTYVVTVSTNNPTGFTAYASIPNTDFVNTEDPNKVIPTISAPMSLSRTADFPTNRWGLAFYTSPDPDVSSSYVPAAASIVAGGYNYRATNYNFPVGIEARLDGEITSGHYVCTMNFQAIPNIIPDTIRSIDYLQDVNAEVAASMTDGVDYQLKDARDGNSYWIRKENNRIFMTENLDFAIENTIQNGVPVHTVLRPDSSDVTTERTLILTEPWGSTSSELYYSGSDNLYYPAGYKTPRDLEDIDPASEETKNSAGAHYSWSSATAGSGISVASAETSAEESICPSGWRLPYGDEANVFTTSLVRSGKFDSATSNIVDVYDGVNANSGAMYLWTSETGATANDIKYIYTSTTMNEVRTGTRNDGYSVRCIAIAPNEFTLVFDTMGGSSALGQYHKISWEESVDYGLSKTMEDAPTKAGFDFMGWSTNQNAGAPEYVNPGDAITLLPGEPTTVYAIWRTPCNTSATTISEAVCLQDVNSTIVSTMTAGQQYQLMDYRDGKNYWIAKLADGKVWMTQNLDFEISSTRTILDPATSDVLEAVTLVASDTSDIRYTDGGDEYYIDGLESTTTSELTPTDTNWHYHAGSFYSWAAATANSAVDGNNIATGSICPNGWTLPEYGDESPAKGFMALTNAYNITDGTHYAVTSTESTAQNSEGQLTYKADFNTSALRASPIYIPQAGYVNENNHTILPGSAARFWTAKQNSASGANAFVIYGSDSQNILQKLANESKNANYSVRCVLK